MGKNRKQPFGWRMEFGQVVIDAGEASWVRNLYREYNLGTPIRQLMAIMQNSGVPYDTGKKWNINMIARILADERYIGADGYPAIIDRDTFHNTAQKREVKAPAVQKTEVQKVLRKKCGCRITPHIEHEVQYLLNTMRGQPERITVPAPGKRNRQKLDALMADMEDLIESLPVNTEQARSKAFEIAAAMYESIDPNQYETQQLKRVFSREKSTELKPELIIYTVSQIQVTSHGKVKVILKNQQVIERREEK